MSRAEPSKSNPPEADFLLFVAGEPDLGETSELRLETSMLRRMAGVFVGALWLGPARRDSTTTEPSVDPSDAEPWHLPAPQIQCANLVAEAAEKVGRRVALIDVNRPAGRHALVAQWVGAADILPLLVRQDGARLSGTEQFSPRPLRRFMSRPAPDPTRWVGGAHKS